MRAQEEERRRLARDLHDEVNQALTAILLRLEALAQDSPAANIEEVNELKRLVNQAMDELLNLARQLRPTALDDHGLMPAVETQLKRFSTRTGVEVTLERRRQRGLAPGGRSDGGLPDPPGGARQRRPSRRCHRRGGGDQGRRRAARAARARRRRRVRPHRDGAGRQERRPRRGTRPQRDGRARAPGRRRARPALGARRRHHRHAQDRPARSGWRLDPRADRRRPRHRPLWPAHADRPPAGHGGRRRGRGRRRGAGVDPGCTIRTSPCWTCRCRA